ncbi:hypothetical protein BDP27DRAFT_1344638 [Rhodocollybia butyracea]|uniref:Uncharacterized protein n=1 Tax=Rhodocollybia butyracea TaxID=206335 RepID=A0A9P5P8E5_9AGAR|nr:hypothetical protein BDP27DRAFT_1344638 [Rhodocollybia butyracea]
MSTSQSENSGSSSNGFEAYTNVNPWAISRTTPSASNSDTPASSVPATQLETETYADQASSSSQSAFAAHSPSGSQTTRTDSSSFNPLSLLERLGLPTLHDEQSPPLFQEKNHSNHGASESNSGSDSFSSIPSSYQPTPQDAPTSFPLHHNSGDFTSPPEHRIPIHPPAPSISAPRWNPGHVGLGLGIGPGSQNPQLVHQARFSPNPNPPPQLYAYAGLGVGPAADSSILPMLQFALQAGPACYPAVHRLFTATAQVHAAAADIIDIVAAQQTQYSTHNPTTSAPASSSSQLPEYPSESFMIPPLDTQSSFWGLANGQAKDDSVNSSTNSNPVPNPARFYPATLGASAGRGVSISKGTAHVPVPGRDRVGKASVNSGIGSNNQERRSHIDTSYENLRLAQDLHNQRISSSSPQNPHYSRLDEELSSYKSPTPPPAYNEYTQRTRDLGSRVAHDKRESRSSRRPSYLGPKSARRSQNRRRRQAAANCKINPELAGGVRS